MIPCVETLVPLLGNARSLAWKRSFPYVETLVPLRGNERFLLKINDR